MLFNGILWCLYFCVHSARRNRTAEVKGEDEESGVKDGEGRGREDQIESMRRSPEER
jgi:hypothetical protein